MQARDFAPATIIHSRSFHSFFGLTSSKAMTQCKQASNARAAQ
jgi:hypothetical protein